MILFWFLIGIVIIALIARYNESNSLFWKLLLAFLLGFAAAKMVIQLTSSEKNRNENVTAQVQPIQKSQSTSDCTVCLLADVTAANPETDCQNSVGKVFAPVLQDMLISSKIFGGIRDQPHFLMDNSPPLGNLIFFDTS